MILAGDIGGTKTVLALFERGSGVLRRQRESVYPSARFAAFDTLLGRFLEETGTGSVEAACFAVAGAVIGGRARITNLPWELDPAELGKQLGTRRVALLNDVESAAYGMLALAPENRVVLQAGSGRRPGNAAVIAAGTGLGQAILYWDGARHRAIPSEAGHRDFPARTDEEIELLRFLRAEFGRVSIERVLSGPGLRHIYRFLRATSRETEPSWLAELFAAEDPSAVIGRVGVEGGEPVCERAVELFARIYGAEAGNLALQCVAVGGVFVGGGIAPKLLPVLLRGDFVRAFCDKQPFAALLETLEVSVATEPRAPLLGAAEHAASL